MLIQTLFQMFFPTAEKGFPVITGTSSRMTKNGSLVGKQASKVHGHGKWRLLLLENSTAGAPSSTLNG